MKVNVDHCGIVILAAGRSSRLGRPKQLLMHNGKTLLRLAVNHALNTHFEPVAVVLGANYNEITDELNDLPVTIIYNSKWDEGIALSIQSGIKKIIENHPETDGIILMVCDQPYLDSKLLLSLQEKQKETGLPIIASHYANKMGTPALFHKQYFIELMELTGDAGAGKLISANLNKTASVEFPEGIMDIDTIEDFNALHS